VSTLDKDMRIAQENERRRREQEKQENFWARVRYYNQLAKSHAKTAERYERLTDELIERGVK
jgi:hypothetical protein